MKLSVIAAISLLSFAVSAQEVPPFANITSVDFRGSGCDADSARVSMTSDLSYISVLYDRFSVGAGAGTGKPLANSDQKNCMVVVKFDLPAGWSFQFEAVEYRGFVSLPDSDSVANQMISVSTPQGRGRNFEQNVIRGPIQDNFVNVYRNPIENLMGEIGKVRHGNRRGGPPVSPPGRRKHIRKGDLFDCSDRVQQAVLRIGSRIAVRGKGSNKEGMQMIVDSTDASFNQKLKISWNQCLRD